MNFTGLRSEGGSLLRGVVAHCSSSSCVAVWGVRRRGWQLSALWFFFQCFSCYSVVDSSVVSCTIAFNRYEEISWSITARTCRSNVRLVFATVSFGSRLVQRLRTCTPLHVHELSTGALKSMLRGNRRDKFVIRNGVSRREIIKFGNM
ncbi:uncharacterized protein LOC143144421 [Ptiloglossa arizonensis]|uniref:uncharacterized protein LOC143144421 n=1 Tax=Ptiloglossa arizonensis TaxID=3350558 RepID=UPI003FA02240